MTDSVNERLELIEKRVQFLEDRLKVTHPHQAPTAPPTPTTELKAPSFLRLWLKENWLACGGIFLIILALGWFILYAFMNNWIGEKTLGFLGVAAGGFIYFMGTSTLKKRPKIGEILITLGHATLLITLITSYHFYKLLPAPATFALTFVVISMAAIVAIRKNLKGLGFSSLFFAAIIPTTISPESWDSYFLVSYVMGINATALLMLMMRRWKNAFNFAWLITLGYSILLMKTSNIWFANFYISLLYVIFFLPVILPLVRGRLSSLRIKAVFILLTLPCFNLLWISWFNKFPWNTIFCFAHSLLWATAGYFLTKNWNQFRPQEQGTRSIWAKIFACASMASLFTGTYYLSDHFFPSSAWDVNAFLFFIETVAAIVLVHFVLRSVTASIYFSLFFFVALTITCWEYQDYLYAKFLNIKFALLCGATLSFTIAAVLNQRAAAHLNSRKMKCIVAAVWLIMGVFSMILIWNIFHQMLPKGSLARAASLTTYVIAAEILIYISYRKQIKFPHRAGVGIITFVLLRLVTIEIWDMPATIRMLTFIVIGILLVGTALLDKHCKTALKMKT